MQSALTTSGFYDCATLDPAILKQRTEQFAEHLSWSRGRILEHQQTSLRQILRHAANKSPYFRDTIGKLVETDASLEDYPTMGKSILMAEFDRIVIDPRLTRTMVEDHAGSRNCGELLLGEYRVAATGSSSGQCGVFVCDRDSWEIVNGTLRRWHRLSGAPPSLRMVGIGAPSPVHLSNRFCAEIRVINTEAPRLSVVTPIEEIVEALNRYPEIYAAGDIVRWSDRHSGKAIRVEHWVVAERQGQTAALNMLNRRTPFAAVPFFWSQHYDVPINCVGHAESWDKITVDGDITKMDCLMRFEEKGRVAAVASIFRDYQNLLAELMMEREVA